MINKKLLLLSLLSTSVYADVFDFKITAQNFYCKPNITCNIYTDFDVLIVNETNQPEHYNLGYNLQLYDPASVYGKSVHIDLKPREIFRKHYHLFWEGFILTKSNSYLLRSAIMVANQPQSNKTTNSTVWVY